MPVLGQIQPFATLTTPAGWLPCNGQTLPIGEHPALFSLLGTRHGGDGELTFAIPDLQATFALGSDGPNGRYPFGQRGGEVTHTLTEPELPQHWHDLSGAKATATEGSPVGNFPAILSAEGYSDTANTTLGAGSDVSGSDQPHPNLPPYLAIGYYIAIAE